MELVDTESDTATDEQLVSHHRMSTYVEQFTDPDASSLEDVSDKPVFLSRYLVVLGYCTGWATKNRTYLTVDNLAMVSGRKACGISEVSECCIEKAQNLHSGAFKYSLLNLQKSSPPLELC